MNTMPNGMPMPSAAAASAGLFAMNAGMIFGTIISLIVAGIPLYIIAQKRGHQSPWLAFIPIANLYLMCEIAEKPITWMLAMLVPCVGVIFLCLAWNDIAEKMGFQNWLGWLMIVPVVNIAVMYYIAFGTPSNA